MPCHRQIILGFSALSICCSDLPGVGFLPFPCIDKSSLLVQGKKEMAKALRVFVDPVNYPILVHCIHGKDRTGLIVMLIMLLCSVEPEVSCHMNERKKEKSAPLGVIMGASV